MFQLLDISEQCLLYVSVYLKCNEVLIKLCSFSVSVTRYLRAMFVVCSCVFKVMHKEYPNIMLLSKYKHYKS